jgi:hypothetical protein
MFEFFKKLTPPSMYKKFTLLDDYSIRLKLTGETIIAWPLNYGIMFWRDGDVREDTCVNARFFNRGDAELFLAALHESQKSDSLMHYEIVKLGFED